MTVQPTFTESAACFLCSAFCSSLSSSRIARAQCVVVCLIALCSLTSFVGWHRAGRQHCSRLAWGGCDETATTRATNTVERLLLQPGEASVPSNSLNVKTSASARPSSSRASKCPRVTIFSAPTAYNVSSYSHRRAIMSWLRLDPTPRVVLLGTHPSLASVAAEFPNHVSVDADVDTNLEGTPLLNSVLARIQAFGAASTAAASPHCDLVVLVDPDVLLFNDVLFAARRLASRFSSFVTLSAPWDVHTFRFSLDSLPPHIHPSSSSAASRDRFPTHVAAPAPSSGAFSTRRRRSARVWDSPDQADSGEVNGVNEQEIRDYVRQRGQLNVAAGATVLMWNRPAAPLLHPSIAIPPFFLGRGSYLRWLVARAAGSLSATAANGTNGNSDGNVTAQVGRAATELEAGDEAGVPAAAWRDDPESRHAVDATDAVTAVRVFSALDAQREAQLVVEKRRGETGVAENSAGTGGRRKKAGFVSRLARSISPRQVPQRRRLLGGAESAHAGRSHHSSGKGSLSAESSSFGQGALWQPLPGKNAKRWEVYANAHTARIQRLAGGLSIEGGSLSHAPWRLAPCFVPGGESMCLMRRRRPGNCSCEHTPFAGRSTGDTRPFDANWLSCGGTGMEQNLDADLLRDLRSGPHGADPSLSSLEDEFALGLEDMGGLRLPSSTQTEPTVAKNNSLTAAVAEATLSARDGMSHSTKGKKASTSEGNQVAARTSAHVAFWRGSEGLPHSLEQLLPIVAGEKQAVILLAASFEDREAAMNSICRLRNLGMGSYILAALDARMYAYAFLQGIPVFMHQASISNQSANAASSNDMSSASRLAAVAPVLMMQILRLGYSVLWADVHTVWFSNPLPYLLSLDSNTLAVQSMSPNMRQAPNSARIIGAGVMFARPSHLSLKALASVVAYTAAVRAEAGEEGGSAGGSGAEGEEEVEEYKAFHDVLCGEGGRFKAGQDLCRWNNGFKVVFLDRRLFPAGSNTGIWDTPPSLGGLGRTCEKLGCIAVQNRGVRGRATRAERLHAHGLTAYDSGRRMCIRSWGVVEQGAQQVQRHFMRR